MEIHQTAAGDAGFAKSGMTLRADLPIVLGSGTTTRTDRALLDFGKQSFLFKCVLIDLIERASWAKNEIDHKPCRAQQEYDSGSQDMKKTALSP